MFKQRMINSILECCDKYKREDLINKSELYLMGIYEIEVAKIDMCD